MESEKEGTKLLSLAHPPLGPRVGVIYLRRAVNPISIFRWKCATVGSGVVYEWKLRMLQNVELSYVEEKGDCLHKTFCLSTVKTMICTC